MVLSFMILWDLPRIAGGVRSLETSRLSTVYAEVAPSVKVFGELFGRALQAQVKPGHGVPQCLSATAVQDSQRQPFCHQIWQAST